MKNKKLGMFFSIIIASLVALGTSVLAEDVNTVVSVEGSVPTVNFIEIPSSFSLVPLEEDNDFNFTCQVTDVDGTSEINLTSSRVYTEDVSYSFNELVVTQVNSTTLNVSGSLDRVEYYQSPGDYPVVCEVDDDTYFGDLTENLTINTLIYSAVSESSLTYDSVYEGETSSTEIFGVQNGGNVDLNSSWEGTDYTSGSDSISVANSKIISSSLGSMTVLSSEKFYGVLETQTDGGNSNSIYNPHFELFVPDGTSSGTYTNTYTHAVSQV